jgi:hypothetical protein
MKLRIKGNSLRLRLGRSEVHRLATEGVVEEVTTFGPGNQLSYALLTSADEKRITATFVGPRIIICAPANVVDQWALTDEVGIRAVQQSGDKELDILIEKDFECLEAPEGESQEDAFARAELGAGACPTPFN